MQKILFHTCLFLITAVAAAQQRPNVVLILADDLGYGDLGCYGQQLIQTPSLDSLAAQGIRFTQFYAGTSVCAPSRAALMTGLHTGHTAVRGNFEVQPEGQAPLPGPAFTVAELFRGRGYATGLFGKWGLGYPGSEGEPLKQGFDRFYGYNCQRQSHNFFPPHLWDDSRQILLANTPNQQQQYAPDLIQAEAMRFLDAHAHRPFFLCLTYTLPHAALQLPQGDSLFEMYKRRFAEEAKPVAATWDGKGYQPQAYPLSAYAAMVTRLDGYVGAVVQKLKSLGIAQNTLILFTSDNGPHREGGNRPEHFNSSGGLRGIKRDLYEGGIRVPMIAYWPARIKQGKTSSWPGAFWDLLPTFAQLTGQPPDQPTDGISFLPLFTNTGRMQERRFLYWEFHEDGGRQAVRMGNWKGVRLNVSKPGSGLFQLFNLANDRAEKKDVSAANPGVVRQMVQIMNEAHVEHKAFPLLAGERK